MTLLSVPFWYIVVFVLSLLIVWQFAGYPLFMALVALRHERAPKDYNHQPFFSVIVPTYNEEASVEARINNLYDLNYPNTNYEIIIVDSGSTDTTVNIVQQHIERQRADQPALSLVRQARREGKGAAINGGKPHARGELIVVTDANCVFNRDALKELAPHFKDPKVGAVGGRYVVRNPDSALTMSTKYYRDLESLLRTGEAALSSACLFDGEINAWRKSLVDIDQTMIAEDLDTCINLRRMGYKIEYEPAAIAYEAVPTTVTDQVTQRKRTSIGTITCILRHLSYLAMPRDLYRTFILPSHKGLTMLSPFFMLTLVGTYAVAFNWPATLLSLAASITAFGLVFAALTRTRARLGESYSTNQITVSAIGRLLFYVLLNEYIVLLAWRDVAFGNYSVLWKKVTTTRKGSEPQRAPQPTSAKHRQSAIASVEACERAELA